ncbi:unnamed protein product [Callosobruchus maculatus]|uniref:Uncharacterized protein n=1 Tax=Callosobruchus maculatus TaxID=64391 RepID=A0A653CR46_CALMS|nr:unnamed protein product [Callosobruchus maculatus]
MLSYITSKNLSLSLVSNVNKFVANMSELLSVQYELTALTILTRDAFW